MSDETFMEFLIL